VGDVAEPDHVWAVCDGALEAFGRVDILVNNVGTWLGSRVTEPLEEATATYERLMAVNTRAAFLFGRALIPQMKRNGRGDIVNIGTDHTYTEPRRPTGGGESMDVYDASKWALNGFTLAWARALEGVVRVNEISMGRTDSEMLRGFSPNSTAEEIATWKTPADIAQLVVDLLEEGPQGRTGFNLPVWWMDPIVIPPADAPWSVRVGTMTATGV
jgi:NAD(P)-dependent dehydrogenase (short-subunit alcohol dehydrogenase family)